MVQIYNVYIICILSANNTMTQDSYIISISFLYDVYIICISFVYHLYIICISFYSYIIFISSVYHLYIIFISSVYHLYIICISFLYHPYIIFISSVYHSYIISISFVYHPYIICISSLYYLYIIPISFVYHLCIICISSLSNTTVQLYHLYIISISFLYHLYIIPISFLYHFYIICISSLYHLCIICISSLYHLYIIPISFVYHLYIICISSISNTTVQLYHFLLGNGERPQFLQLEYVHKAFTLELIEGVLTDHHQLFRKHSEHLFLLQHHLFLLLLKTLYERSAFLLALRGTPSARVEEGARDGNHARMCGVGVAVSNSESHLHGRHNLDSIVEMVATVPTMTASNVVEVISTEAGLSVKTAAMKLDKADAPLIPEAYTYLLGVQFFISLSDGLGGYTFPHKVTLAYQICLRRL
ncbi:hypothetical protein V8E52_008661 [Russula decolorans]